MESKRLIKTKGLEFSCEECDYKTLKKKSLLKHRGCGQVCDVDNDRYHGSKNNDDGHGIGTMVVKPIQFNLDKSFDILSHVVYQFFDHRVVLQTDGKVIDSGRCAIHLVGPICEIHTILVISGS